MRHSPSASVGIAFSIFPRINAVSASKLRPKSRSIVLSAYILVSVKFGVCPVITSELPEYDAVYASTSTEVSDEIVSESSSAVMTF